LRLVWVAVAAISTVGAIAGCASRERCRCAGGGMGTATAESAAQVTARGTISPDVTAVASYESVERALGGTTLPSQYRAIDARQCQCLAAANAVVANLLDEESALAARAPRRGRRGSAGAGAVQSDLLAFRAVEERNHAAGKALERFYQAAEAEGSRDLLRQMLEEIDRAIRNFEQLEARGLRAEAEKGALRRQKIEMLGRRAELELSIQQLNGELRHLLGLDGQDFTPIWPVADLKVAVAPVDKERAVTEGLASRADLGMLEMLSETLDRNTLPAARGGLGRIEMLLGAGAAGAQSPLGRLLDKSGQTEELETRQRQVSDLLAKSRAGAVEEIRQAAYAVETRLRQVALAKEARESWQKRLEQLRGRRDSDDVTAFDVSAAQIEVVRAETQLLHEVVAWRIAEVKLLEAQGLLALECGYSLPDWRCGGE